MSGEKGGGKQPFSRRRRERVTGGCEGRGLHPGRV